MTNKNIPFNFVFDYLYPVEVIVKPMFGMFFIYAGDKIILILRRRKNEEHLNGVWIACKSDDHMTLKKEFPSLRSISCLEVATDETEWQMLPETSDDFEPSVIRVCKLIIRSDPRIGRVPQPRKRKKRKSGVR